QHHDLYTKYQAQDSEISGLLGECGLTAGLFICHQFLSIPTAHPLLVSDLRRPVNDQGPDPVP
ncbi:hypothetical protein ACROSR_20485, partial [Roseovarius tibetensis]|uniref:hypothetical protein n=1 Tax=Roseovarius tibetensis TaxID=2685897 RepID=UPI003D7FE439